MITLKTDVMKYKNANGKMEEISAIIGKKATDISLTQSGVGADAKVVGNKLNKLTTDVNDHQRQINVERERINQFTKLGEGSTTGDAELVDARVDFNGKTWDNVGDHVRGVSSQLSGQIDDTKTIIDDFLQKKYEDVFKNKEAYLINSIFYANGYTSENNDMNILCIQVKPNTTYVFGQIHESLCFVKRSIRGYVETTSDDFLSEHNTESLVDSSRIGETFSGSFTTHENTKFLFVKMASSVDLNTVALLKADSLDGIIADNYVSPFFKRRIAFDTAIYDQAFVFEESLDCTNGCISTSGVVAKYVKVDMGANIKELCARVKWVHCTSDDIDGSVALVITNLDTRYPVEDITKGSIHLVFSCDGLSVGIYAETNDIIARFGYSKLVPNTEYDIGFKVAGSTLTITLPNGDTQTVTDSRIATYWGKYAIWEHFISDVQETEIPTNVFPHAVFTGLYAVNMENMRLRDNFKRQNGSIGIAPTGHIYKTFRNSHTSDTKYDNGNGYVN